jgi:hypothetical protein
MDLSGRSSEVHPIDRIQPEQVYNTINWLLTMREKKQLIQYPETPDMDGVSVYFSEFAPDGCLQFYPVIRSTMTETDFLRFTYVRCGWNISTEIHRQTKMKVCKRPFNF